MKKFNVRKILLGLALLGSFAAPAATPVAQAAPPDRAPAYGRRDKDKRRNNERYDRKRYDNDRDYRDRYNRNQANNRNNATYSGTVSNVRAGNSFDLNANGRTYNVYTTSGVPRGLSEGDRVRVYGRPYGDNDIRNASVSIIRNDRDDSRPTNNGDYGSYRTYTGIVTDVHNDREFDVRIGGQTYNVYASSPTRGLNRGDEVRVYGQRYGDNDIRNASARISRNR